MTISATPGSTLACTLQLPQAASDVVRWYLTDPFGAVVADGRQPATGTLVMVALVMPSEAFVPLDGSEYALTATDGVTSAREGVRVVSRVDPAEAHNGEIAYASGTPFVDTLVCDEPLSMLTAAIQAIDGTVLATAQPNVTTVTRLGEAFAYPLVGPVVNTQTATTYGIGTVSYTGTTQGKLPFGPEYHAYWTITPYTATFIAAIRKLADRARVGDANPYLDIRPADLASALLRGMEYVMQAPPLSTPFALDQIPISLRDYVIKAAAVDLLRAQYLAEGMSTFQFAGQGTQLDVDRSQYLDALVQQLQGDLQNLEKAKGAWIAQGMPMGATVTPGRRPLGVLSITTGIFSNYLAPGFLPTLDDGAGGYSFLTGQRMRMEQLVMRTAGSLAASPGAPGTQLVMPSVPPGDSRRAAPRRR